MKLGKKGLELIKSFEGLRLVAYDDGGGVWTIGYGHTKGVKRGDTCTMEQAEAWLVEDVEEAEDAVKKWVDVPLVQDQFDALVSFVFNVGPGKPGLNKGFYSSTMRRLLNQSDYIGASNEFPRWNKDNGKVVAGLTRRREAERRLFLFRDDFLATELVMG